MTFSTSSSAMVGGLIIGVGEKLTEFYWGPLMGGGTDAWFAVLYVAAVVGLLAAAVTNGEPKPTPVPSG